MLEREMNNTVTKASNICLITIANQHPAAYKDCRRRTVASFLSILGIGLGRDVNAVLLGWHNSRTSRNWVDRVVHGSPVVEVHLIRLKSLCNGSRLSVAVGPNKVCRFISVGIDRPVSRCRACLRSAVQRCNTPTWRPSVVVRTDKDE